MQYRAIFSDADATSAGGPEGSDGAGSAAREHALSDAKPLARVLFSWAHHRVQFFVDRMQQLLPTCALTAGKGA
jgi:hypothetical protein